MRAPILSCALVSAIGLTSCGLPASWPRPSTTAQASGDSREAVAGGRAKQEPAPPPIVSEPPREPSRERFGGATCAAGDVVELGTSGVRTLRPRLAFSGPSAGLAVWPTGEDHLAVRALRAHEIGPLVDVELDQAVGLAALGSAGPRGFIAFSVVPLCGNGHGNACERARGLTPDGTPTGAPYEPEPADQWGMVSGVASTTDGLAVSVWYRWGGGLRIFRIGPSGQIELEAHDIRTVGSGDVPIRALTAQGTRVAAHGLERSETTISETPFVLALGGRRHLLRMVPEESELVRLSIDGNTATVVFRPPRSRARWVRVSTADGSTVDAGGTLTSSDALPTDLAQVVVPEVAVARRRLIVRRRDLAGTEIGVPFEIATVAGRPLVQTAWSGDDLAVLWATRTGRRWRVMLRRVRCSPP